MTYEEARERLRLECCGCMHPQEVGYCKKYCHIGVACRCIDKCIEHEETMDAIRYVFRSARESEEK